MEYGKYIVVRIAKTEMAIMFDSIIAHSDLFISFHKDSIVSAGNFVIGAAPTKEDEQDISVDVFGESITLDIGVRKGKDEKLIKKVLRHEFM